MATWLTLVDNTASGFALQPSICPNLRLAYTRRLTFVFAFEAKRPFVLNGFRVLFRIETLSKVQGNGYQCVYGAAGPPIFKIIVWTGNDAMIHVLLFNLKPSLTSKVPRVQDFPFKLLQCTELRTDKQASDQTIDDSGRQTERTDEHENE